MASSLEYIQALREQNYLKFLEWSTFLLEHYQLLEHGFSTDELLDLMAFDWLECGFCSDDLKAIAVLNCVHETKPEFYPQKTAYDLVSVTLAALHCMALSRKRLVTETYPKSVREKIAFIEANKVSLDESQEAFDTLKANVEQEALLAYASMEPIIRLRTLVERYQEHLQLNKREDDATWETRGEITEGLFRYLSGQPIYTPIVQNEVDKYCKSLRKQGAGPSEALYLDELAPSTSNTTMLTVLTVGYQLFGLLGLNQYSGVANAGEPSKPQNGPGAGGL